MFRISPVNSIRPGTPEIAGSGCRTDIFQPVSGNAFWVKYICPGIIAV